MELKTRYQYTNFIHTFVINKGSYSRYMMKLLKDERFELRIFQKEKDLELYTYFLPKMRGFLFKTFDFDKNRQNKFNELPLETKAAILADMPSVTFECNLSKDIHGKTVDENSIFFRIQKIGVICFNTGVCFLYFKTNIEGSKEFSDVLNFNYKFRDINQDYSNLKNYDNIKVQTDSFENIRELQDFIGEIAGPNFNALKINLDVERFYTYSYTCVEQNAWNDSNSFDNIKQDFEKYINIYPNDKNIDVSEDKTVRVVSQGKYAKLGISKLGVNLLSSDVDMSNYTVLPKEFENQYFYTYILSLYLKVYLKKVNYEFKVGKELDIARQKFVEFTKELWIQEITSEDMGSLVYQSIRDSLELEKLYGEVKNKYDILYRELKIEKNEKTSKFIAVILVLTLIVNIINWISYLGR